METLAEILGFKCNQFRYTAFNCNGYPLVSVTAENEEDARHKLENITSYYGMSESWNSGGKVIKQG